MDEMSDDLMDHGDVARALRNIMRRGIRSGESGGLEGLRQLMEKLRQRRQENLERFNLDSVFDDIKERLSNVVQTEREGIDRRIQETRERATQSTEIDSDQMGDLLKMLEERANRNRERLDALPDSPAGAIKELSQYEFMDPGAQQQFQELLDMLKQQMLQNHIQGLKQQLQNTTPEQIAALREMLQDLNQMIHDRIMGRDPNFQQFMDKHRSMFGETPPKDLDDLIDCLARQMAQMQSLLESMSPEVRWELEQMAESLLDPETAQELAELAAAMEDVYPMEDLRSQYPFLGEESLTMDQAMQMMGKLQDMDQLERQLQDLQQRGDIDDLDLGKVEELLGEEARRAAEPLKRLAERLEQAGYIARKGDRLELTPRGIRKIGQKALQELFTQLKRDRMGNHEIHARGSAGEETGETKAYEFGDPLDIDLKRTIINAVVRNGPRVPVRVGLDDFEVVRKEEMTQSATCLLLDQSRSMGMFGSFQAAKKVALALYTLVRSQFPRDKLWVLGFSDQAIEIKGDDLPETTWNAWMSGTNMHHAFMLSRKLLSRYKGGAKQIIMITDGEPTAHLEGDRIYFAYPPSHRTIQETLKEVRRCTHDGIIINTFMLETSHYLLDFVDRMTRINKGRAFYTTPDKLGEFVLVDYLSNRRRKVVH